jgi:hypothetical protein
MKSIKKFVLYLGSIVGFVSSVLGIVSFLQTDLHLGSIPIPNPIIIIVAIVVSGISLFCLFYLGQLYGTYSLLAGVFRMRKSLPFHTFFFQYWYYRFFSRKQKGPESSLAQQLYETSSAIPLSKEWEDLRIQIFPELKITRGNHDTKQ